ERRADLVREIESAATRGAQVAAQPQAVMQSVPSVAAYTAPATVARVPRREHKPLSWTTVLVVTGAFLVIVAAAIFALAAWNVFGVGFQLFFLSSLTVAFYGAGVLVRRRLGSSAGGVALIVVASAMLLFDGWLMISAFGLSGPWPWAGWLLVCSAVYWFTETRLTGGVFGASGAAAQIAWWWLLGEGLGWDPLPRLAGIAVVAVVWAWAAERGRETLATAPLASVLRRAAPVTVGLTVLGSLMFVEGSSTEFVIVASVLVVGWSGTAIAELLSLKRPLGSLAHVPSVFVALGVIGASTGGWGVSILLLLGALAAALYDIVRDSAPHGLMSPVLGAGAAAAIGVTLGMPAGSQVALVAVIVSFWPLGSAVLRSKRIELPEWCAGAASAGESLHVGGVVVLGFTSFALLPALGTMPLIGGPWCAADTIAVAWVMLAWAIVAFGGRSAVGAAGLAASSFLLLAAVLDVADLQWEATLLALPSLGLALAWVLVREPVERYGGLPQGLLLGGMRVLTPVVVVVGLLVDAVVLTDMHWSAGVLLWAAAVWWVIDRAIDRQALSLVPVAVFGAAGAAALGWWQGAPADGAVAAAVFSLAGVLVGFLMRSRAGMGCVLTWALVATSSLLSILAFENTGLLASALGFTAAAAVVAVLSSGWCEGVVVPVVLGTGATLVALEYWAVEPWATVLALGVAGFACLAPALMRTGEQPSDSERFDRTLAVSGFVPLGSGVMIGLVATTGLSMAGWAQLDGHLFAVLLLLGGVYVLAAATRYQLEPAFYLGIGVLVLALFAELHALDAGWVELYSTPAALYLAWCGYRWAGRDGGRRVPLVSDVGVTAVALGIPFVAMLDPWIPTIDSWVHTFAVVGLALLAMTLGVVLRSRGYFLGGIAALVLTALVRSWDVLVLWWWLVLGAVGTGMIVVALARELRQVMAAGVRDLMQGWR
ncbi:MAG: hypothetical protein RBS17_09205, partial [Coriobacteriia bacterium]|nr:hypothetical protein [Coriobacteriia bacterium]